MQGDRWNTEAKKHCICTEEGGGGKKVRPATQQLVCQKHQATAHLLVIRLMQLLCTAQNKIEAKQRKEPANTRRCTQTTAGACTSCRVVSHTLRSSSLDTAQCQAGSSLPLHAALSMAHGRRSLENKNAIGSINDVQRKNNSDARWERESVCVCVCDAAQRERAPAHSTASQPPPVH